MSTQITGVNHEDEGRFGKFALEPPLSEAMQAFAAKHDVVDLVVQEDG